MGKLEVGIDLVEISRFTATVERRGLLFLEKVFNKDEINQCSKYSHPMPHYAARFAAKEAISKALGTGIGAHLSFHDIHIKNLKSGKPYIELSDKANIHFNYPKISLSLTHTKDHAIASVLIQYSWLTGLKKLLRSLNFFSKNR